MSFVAQPDFYGPDEGGRGRSFWTRLAALVEGLAAVWEEVPSLMQGRHAIPGLLGWL